MISIRIALLALALCYGSSAWSESALGGGGPRPEVVWSTPAMACVPTATTAAEAKYVTTGGRIKFKDGHSGTLSFVCPVSVPIPGGTYVLEGRANLPTPDTTGVGFALRQAFYTSGEVTTLLETDGVKASPTSSAPAFRVIVNVVPRYLGLSPNNGYWVLITHQRPGVSILSVHLVRLPEPVAD